MAPTTTRSWILSEKPRKLPTITGLNPTFKLEERPLPELKTDQVLVQLKYLSNDPAQRGWISPDIPKERLYVPPVELGAPMNSRALAEVIDSKSDNLQPGTLVQCSPGWSEYAVLDAKTCNPVKELPGGLSISQYLGAFGGTGLTAWYGLTVIGEAKKDDVVVVSGAAGATGQMVVQIAKKIVGCKTVIGIAGTDEKCKWVESLGADKCINYKSKTFEKDLIEATPDYCNLYFDNVGGEILDLMLGRMAMYGRISLCGAISGYNSEGVPLQLKNYFQLITMRLQARGFIIIDFIAQGKAPETIKMLVQACSEGKLKIDNESEHVVPAKFEEVPQVWLKLFEGANQGKLITKL